MWVWTFLIVVIFLNRIPVLFGKLGGLTGRELWVTSDNVFGTA